MEKRKIDFNEENIEKCAEVTIYEIWSCIDWDKVDAKRAYGIWDEFGSKVKASAMSTNSYETFVEKLCKKMDIRSLRYKSIKDIGEQQKEFKDAVLKHIREKTLQLVLKVRLNNEARREMKKELERKQKEQEEKQQEYNATQISFTKKGVKVNE